MGKKNKQPSVPVKAASAAASEPILSRRGKKVIAAGVVAVVVGFWIVTFTDPAGRNWASNLCPFVILGGYALIGVGIVTPDPEESSLPALPPK
jgi:hypothetical protein